MKKILCLLLILLLACSVAGCAVTPNGSSEGTEPYAESETETSEEKTTVEETTVVTESEIETTTMSETRPDVLRDCMAAYQEYLLKVLPDIIIDEYTKESIRFGFIYLNDDEVPELWYNDSLGAHGPNYVIRTFRDGRVSEVGEGFTIMEYYKKQGVFCFTAAGGAAGYDVTYYKMTEDGCEQLDRYVEYLDTSAEPDQAGDMPVIRQLNDIDVSEEEHQAFLDRYAARYGQLTSIENDDGYPLSEENIFANCN